jgi:predicted glycosyltransferase
MTPVSKPALLLYCQSSLGIGHAVRSLTIAGGLVRSFEVHFLSGGESVPELPVPDGVHVEQLPPFKADPEFESLQPPPGLTLEETFERRARLILDCYARVKPAVVMVELYPFGRGQFGHELKPLLTAARRDGVAVASSVRDILVQRVDPHPYEQKVVDRMNRYFDLLLIHGDPCFQALSETFSRLEDIRADIVYTGYVVPQVPAPAPTAAPTIVASIGGGRFGHELAEAVVAAAPLLAERIPHHITLYTGPLCPPAVAEELRARGGGQSNLTVERFTPDLPGAMRQAALSISMGGYNTTMNVLATGARALMLGCANNGGMDQVRRVEALARLGVVEVLTHEDLAPGRLADRIIRALDKEPATPTIELNGVENTRCELEQLLQRSANAIACREPLDA